MNKLILLVICILIINACDLTGPQRFEDDQLVIAGYLQAGKNVSMQNPIFIGKTAPANGGHFLDVFIVDAQVTITNMNDGQIDTLSFDMTEYEIGFYNDNILVKAGNTYKIEVHTIIDSQEVYAFAETTVPDSISIDLDHNQVASDVYGYADQSSENLPSIPYDRIETDFPVYIELNSSEVVYSYYNFYCLEDFSTDLEFTQPFMSFTHLEPEDESAYNSPLENNLRENNMLWRYQPQQDDEGNWFLLDDYYAAGFSYYARYRLTIYSVDENFYTYKFHSESYLYGGITGGIGYFGSVAGEDFYTTVTK